MTNYYAQGNKTVKCACGNLCVIPFQTTIYKCTMCGEYCVSKFFGVVVDKYGNYIY